MWLLIHGLSTRAPGGNFRPLYDRRTVWLACRSALSRGTTSARYQRSTLPASCTRAGIKSGEALDLKNEISLREIAAIYRSDLTLMISEFEMEILCDEFGINESLLAYWPFSLELSDERVLLEIGKISF